MVEHLNEILAGIGEGYRKSGFRRAKVLISVKHGKIRTRLRTNRKSPARFRLVPKLTSTEDGTLLEGVQRSRRDDGKRQIVPYTSCSDTKCSVVDGAASCTCHDQLVGRCRCQVLSSCCGPVQVSCQYATCSWTSCRCRCDCMRQRKTSRLYNIVIYVTTDFTDLNLY